MIARTIAIKTNAPTIIVNINILIGLLSLVLGPIVSNEFICVTWRIIRDHLRLAFGIPGWLCFTFGSLWGELGFNLGISICAELVGPTGGNIEKVWGF